MRARPPPTRRWCRSPCPRSPGAPRSSRSGRGCVDVCSSMMTAFLMSAERPWMRPSMNACSFLASSYSAFSLMSPCSLASWMRAATSARRTFTSSSSSARRSARPCRETYWGLLFTRLPLERRDAPGRRPVPGDSRRNGTTEGARTCVAHSVSVPERGAYTIRAPSVKPEHQTSVPRGLPGRSGGPGQPPARRDLAACWFVVGGYRVISRVSTTRMRSG